MSKIYLVTEGCYSDYTVRAAFSRVEKAEEFAYQINGPGLVSSELRIEVYPLDPDPKVKTELKYRKAWTVWAEEVEDTTKIHPAMERFAFAEETARSLKPGKVKNLTDGVWYTSLVSPEHAKKLAVEGTQNKLRQRIRELGGAYDSK